MNREETIKVFAVLKANYRNFFKDMSKVDAEALVALWQDMFSSDAYELVGAAVKAYIATDTNGYPPNVGQIKEHIRRLTKKEEMTEQEAVNLVLKACSRSLYYAKEEFDKLPAVLQKLVGSPSHLKDMAMMNSDEINTVVSSNLMRSYKVMVERERQMQALPSSVTALLEQTSDMLRIEG